jgi:hypothetical protein
MHAAFWLPLIVFSLLQTLKNMIEDTGTEEAIPLPNVTGKILSKVRSFSRLA